MAKLFALKKEDISNEQVLREELDTNTRLDGKVSLVWDYYSQYVTAPVRDGKIEGINVVSPSFYEISASGDIDSNIGTDGKAYIE